jgi:hypothetical protein
MNHGPFGTETIDTAFRIVESADRRTLTILWNDPTVFKNGDTLLTHIVTAYLAEPLNADSLPREGRACEHLGLQILPRPERGAGVYQLVCKGQPVPETRVLAETTGGAALPVLLSDEEGFFTFTPPNPGLYGFRARLTVVEAVEHNARCYPKRCYVNSLIVRVPTVLGRERDSGS